MYNMSVRNKITMFYVYCYLDVFNRPYYIGKGKGNRYRKKHHNVPVPPLDRIVFLVKDTTDEWSCFMEKYYIDHYGRLDDGTGTLLNKTDGGDGLNGSIVVTEDHREWSRMNMINNPPMNRIDDETRQRMSKELSIRMKKNNPTNSSLVRNKISKSRKGVPSKKWKYCITFNNGTEIIVTNLKEWCKENNHSYVGVIRVKNGIYKKNKDIVSVVRI